MISIEKEDSIEDIQCTGYIDRSLGVIHHDWDTCPIHETGEEPGVAEIQITVQGNVRIGEYCPGNGTRYTAIAVPISHDGAPIGVMGAVSEGWLVAYGNGRAHLFQKDGYLSDGYLAEKLGVRAGDQPFAGNLIRELIGR